MNIFNYIYSLEFDRKRVIKKNDKQLNNLKIIKVINNLSKSNEYQYINLDQKINNKNNIIIVIDNNLLRIDNETIYIDQKINNIKENYPFFKKNKFNKSYLKIKNKILLNIYKKIMKIYNLSFKYKLSIKDIYLINYDENINNNYMIYELDNLLYAKSLQEKERINFIYDYMCDYLDQEFNNLNLCDFKNNKCSSRRELEVKCCKKPLIYGCCYTKNRVCPYLINQKCSIKSISCKLFTCRYLQKRGIKYSASDYLICQIFLNYRQIQIINNSIYTPKSVIIEKLLNKKASDYLINSVKKIVYNFNIIF